MPRAKATGNVVTEVVPRRWLTPEEAAVYLGVNLRWLESRRADPDGPPFHKPTFKTIRYSMAELDRWMQEQPGHQVA